MTDKPNNNQKRTSWTGAEFATFGMALHGSAHGWQSATARMLGVDSRTVRRWVKSGPPDRVRDELLRMTGIDDAARAFPRDEWIIGDGAETASKTRREYIIHARPPRFIARVIELDELTQEPQPDEDPVDMKTGIIYRAAPDSVLCEFQWIDSPPTDRQLVSLLEAASDAITEG